MDIDKLMAMSSGELDDYLETEVEKIIQSAPKEKQDRLRAIHNGARLQVQAAKNPIDAMLRVNKLMWTSHAELVVAFDNLILEVV